MVYMQDWAYIIPVPLIDKDRVADAARSTGRQTDAAADADAGTETHTHRHTHTHTSHAETEVQPRTGRQPRKALSPS